MKSEFPDLASDRESPFESASLSDLGRVRQANEDCFGQAARSDGSQLWVVADGMGGHQGGQEASRTAVATLEAHFRAASPEAPLDATLRQGIEEANATIYAHAAADPTLEGMGTTVVALALSPSGQGAIAHVGDSRAYQLLPHRLVRLTVDHSVVAEMIERGLLSEQEASRHPRRNEILRSVGVLPDVQAEVTDVLLEPGECLLLCSDGLSGELLNSEIESILANAAPEQAAASLVRLANERGGPDNITAQVIRFQAEAEAASAGTGTGTGAMHRVRSPASDGTEERAQPDPYATEATGEASPADRENQIVGDATAFPEPAEPDTGVRDQPEGNSLPRTLGIAFSLILAFIVWLRCTNA